MVPDEPTDVTDSADQAPTDTVESTLLDALGGPGRSVAVAIGVLVVLLYGVLIQQELLLVVWLLAVGFMAYLFWRFVRAHERIAGAAVRLADQRD